MLQFLEEFLTKKFDKEIRQEAISQWRRTICGDLSSDFSKYEGKKIEKLPFLSKDPFIEKIYNAKFKNEPIGIKKLSAEEIAQINKNPSSSSLMPQQEPGIRPSCSLPYQLYVDGRLSQDKKKFELTMKAANEIFGARSEGSPFNVYAPGWYLSVESENESNKFFEPLCTWHYAVKSGDVLRDIWPLNSFEEENYHLRVYGPNGFFREFAGNDNDPALEIDCGCQRSRILKNKLTGNLELKIKNLNPGQSYRLDIIDMAYKNKPISRIIPASAEDTLLLDMKRSYSWCDFTVNIKGDLSFFKRYSGRVEAGKETYSDPAMGKLEV